MRFYDIHTHRREVHSDIISVVSVDLGDEAVRNSQSLLPDRGLQDGIPCDFDSYSEIREGNAFFSVGVHPWHVASIRMEVVQSLALNPCVIAIGETGLDKATAKTLQDFSLQHALFLEHIQLSEKIRKPLIIHCVRAWNELLHIRKTVKPSMPWIIHGFRGKAATASQLLEAGLFLSFGAFYHPEALKIAWEKKRLLAETDDKNISIKEIYCQIADDLHIPLETLAEEIETIFKTSLLSH